MWVFNVSSFIVQYVFSVSLDKSCVLPTTVCSLHTRREVILEAVTAVGNKKKPDAWEKCMVLDFKKKQKAKTKPLTSREGLPFIVSFLCVFPFLFSFFSFLCSDFFFF